jgi:hypothetical protein
VRVIWPESAHKSPRDQRALVEAASTAVSPTISPETAQLEVPDLEERERVRELAAITATSAVSQVISPETAAAHKVRTLTPTLVAEVETVTSAVSPDISLAIAQAPRLETDPEVPRDPETASSAVSQVISLVTAELKLGREGYY